MRLSERVAIITGGSSGIGAAAAMAIAREGATVVLLARRLERLEEVAARVADNGGTAVVHAVDVSDTTRLTTVVEEVAAEHGRLDILVNNAGYGYWEAWSDADPDEWRREVEVNLLAPMYASRAAIPHMLAGGGGHVVNVSSMASRYPAPEGVGYVASKAGLNSFSESTLSALNRRGVKVTLIETGEAATEMQTDDDIASMRMLEADDVAEAIVFALTRPSRVCINTIQMFAPKDP